MSPTMTMSLFLLPQQVAKFGMFVVAAPVVPHPQIPQSPRSPKLLQYLQLSGHLSGVIRMKPEESK